MTAIRVNPDVLVWARRQRGLTKSEAANRLRISEADFEALESSETLKIGQLREMAAKYQITFASLLMPEPLPDSTRLNVRDYRTVGGRSPQTDHQLFVQLDDLNAQLELLSEIKSAAPDLFRGADLPRATLATDVEKLAEQERHRTNVTVQAQISWPTETNAFRRWRAVVEAQGIFVYSLKLGVPKVCRGLSILDNREIPLAVINAEEGSYRARNFTLWHEYAHILLRETGISDENRKNEVEKFCNQFSAYFLMPRKEFYVEAEDIAPKSGVWTDYHVQRLAKRFKVSLTVCSIHMEDTAVVEPGYYAESRKIWSMHRAKKSGGIATHAEKKLNKLGVHHVELVLSALDRGRIDKLDAHELLEVRARDFEALRAEAEARREAYGGPG